MRHRAFRAALIVVVLMAVSTIAAAQAKSAPADPMMKLQGVDGKVYDVTDLRGNVVLVSFGATWCPPCTAELRALSQLLNEYRDKPVKFFWVSIDRPDEVSNTDLKRYARERKLNFPVLRDSDRMVFLQFTERVRLPMIVMLGKDGRVDVPVKFGMQSQIDVYKADIRARLNKLLALPSISGRGTEGEGAKRAADYRQTLTPALSQRERE